MSATPVVDDVAQTSADQDDTWCEFGTTCTTDVSDYISKTKGNGAYGDQNGVIGTFDVVLRTFLNGRQAQWTVKYFRDSGPAPTISATINCVKDQVFDGSCGHFTVRMVTVNTSWTSSLIYGNRIADNKPDNYFSTINGTFTAGGKSYRLATLAGASFDCPSGPGRCSFP